MSFNKVNQTTGELTRIAGNGDVPIDSVPTQGSANAVQSGGTFNAIKAVSDDVDELDSQMQTLTSAFVNNVNENGCKNILPNYITPFSSGGAYVAIDDDGIITVTASSALTGNCNIYPVGDSNIEENKKLYLPKGTYIGSGCPSGGSDSTYYVSFYNQSLFVNLGYDYGEGVEFTLDRDTWIIVRASVRSGYTISDSVVFKPMITLATDVPSDYAHYVSFAKTNLQLTQDSVSWVDAAHIGAVNWCPNDATTQSISDGTTSFTFTVNSDKSVTVSAPSYPVTLASTISLDLHTFTGNEDFVGKTVKASGGVESGIRLVAYRALTADGSTGSVDIEGDAQIFTWANNGSGTKAKMNIAMMSGKTLSGPVTFKPMIAPVDYNGPYVPHAMTNRELTEKKVDILTKWIPTLMSTTIGEGLITDLDTPLTSPTQNGMLGFNRYNPSASNKPSNNSGVVLTWQTSGNYGCQLVLSDGGLYFRTNYNSKVSSWKQVAFTT